MEQCRNERGRRWRLIGREVDTATLHLPRFDAGGEEHHLASPANVRALDWTAHGTGRRVELAPGLAVEVDTVYSTGQAVRVTLGPEWTWPRGGVDLEGVAALVGPLDNATVQRVDVCHDFAAPTLDAAERVILKFYEDCRALPPHRGQPAIWGREGNSSKGLQAALGMRGSSVQRRAYIKTSPFHWKRLQVYAPQWLARGWRGIECPAGHGGPVPGRPCATCGQRVGFAPVLRFEVEWPAKYLKDTRPAELVDALGWVADPGGRGRGCLLDPPTPRLVADRIRALGRERERPRQRRTDPTAEGQVTYWHQIAEHARAVAEDVAARSPAGSARLAELRQAPRRRP